MSTVQNTPAQGVNPNPCQSFSIQFNFVSRLELEEMQWALSERIDSLQEHLIEIAREEGIDSDAVTRAQSSLYHIQRIQAHLMRSLADVVLPPKSN